MCARYASIVSVAHHHIPLTAVLVLSSLSFFLPACGAEPDPGASAPGSDEPSGSGSGGTTAQASGGAAQDSTTGQIVFEPAGGSYGAGGSETTVPVEIFDTLPTGFTFADVDNPDTSRGGYRLLGPLAEVAAPEGECGNILRIITRKFESAHDDFENAGDWSPYEVLSPIGDSRKPSKTSENGPERFEEWYQNLEGINIPFAVDLWLEPVGETYVFDSTAFFPLQELGYEYLFTTELHTNFTYNGGEVFTFRGDDDVFVFVNGYEAVNLSGVHTAQEGSVALDDVAVDFGLEVGGSYTFDLFQAERQPSESNFRLETTLDFTGCGEILPEDTIIR